MASEDAVLAVDVGGTDTKSALGVRRGRPADGYSGGRPGGAGQVLLEDIRRFPTPTGIGAASTSGSERENGQPGGRSPAPSAGDGHPGRGEAVVQRIAQLVSDYSAAWPGLRLRAVGVIVPGLVDEERGIGLFSANLGWRRFPFSERIRAATGLPVSFGHDVGVAGEAEVRLGAAKGRRDAVVMIIGTGIAGAVFCGGVRVQGGGYAGELGHARVPNGEQCPCGAYGCLESVGSAGAIVRRYAGLTGTQPAGAREVLARAAAGEAAAQEVLEDAVAAISFSIGQLTAVLGTDTVVIGGGLAQAGEQLLEPLRRSVDAQLSFHRRPAIVAAKMGQDAGLIGASLRAWDLVPGPAEPYGNAQPHGNAQRPGSAGVRQ